MSSTSSNTTASTSSSEGGFARFGLHASLTRAVADAGFTEPRPIQYDTIPACLEGRDVMGLAQTGTGKTAAFGLPILQRLIEEPGKGPLVLILAPTRELALQIDAEIRMLAKHTSIKTMTIFGGVSARNQIQALRRRPEIVVGCPGRVLDLLNQRELDLSEVETLVLDEADHMFDMGFLPDIRRILSALPNDRQNLLFSATMPNEIRDLAHNVLHKPHVVELAHTAPAERIEHFLRPTPEGRKRELLDRVLGEDDCRTAIIFTRTKHRAKRLALQLVKAGVNAVALQGNMSQPQRDRAMGGFRAGKFDILVATDIAARGLDVAGVDYVINFDPPNKAETYTHRIGRTGRSDAFGKAVTFVTRDDSAWVRDTEKMLGSPIEQRRYPGFDDEVIDNAPRGRGGSGQGQRRSGQGQRGRSGSGGQGGQRSEGQRSEGQRGQGRSGATSQGKPGQQQRQPSRRTSGPGGSGRSGGPARSGGSGQGASRGRSRNRSR